MAKGLTDSQHYTDIAAAIRAKKGTSETLTPGQMAAEISGIFTAPTLQDKTVTPSSEQQTITADEGYDGLGTVTVKAAEGLVLTENMGIYYKGKAMSETNAALVSESYAIGEV